MIIAKREIIAEYPDDEPGPSALILGFLGTFPHHVVAAECEDHIRIVTVYKPEEDGWVCRAKFIISNWCKSNLRKG